MPKHSELFKRVYSRSSRQILGSVEIGWGSIPALPTEKVRLGFAIRLIGVAAPRPDNTGDFYMKDAIEILRSHTYEEVWPKATMPGEDGRRILILILLIFLASFFASFGVLLLVV